MMYSLLSPAFAAARMFTESLLSNDDISLLLHVEHAYKAVAQIRYNMLDFRCSEDTNCALLRSDNVQS
jgi:hypothetical protein